MESKIHTKQKLQTLVWQWRGVLISTPTVAAVVLLLRLTGLLQFWEWAAFDFYTRYKPPIAPDERIVIVGINEDDLREVGQALIPDGIYAQLLQKLNQMQPRGIGLLVYRDLPVPPGNAELIETFKTTPNLVGIQKTVGSRQDDAVASPPILEALKQVGASDMVVDADHRVRRGLLYLENPYGETVYSFGFRLALEYLGAEGIHPEAIAGTTDWRLGKQVFFPLEPNDGGYVRADTNGYQILLNYQGNKGNFETVSLMDVLTDQLPISWGKDRIILIGPVSESFNDLFPTPYSTHRFELPEQMAGVEIQAHLISQVIQAAMGEVPLMQTPSEMLELMWILLWAGLGSSLVWTRRYYKNKFTLILQISGMIAAAFILVGITYCAFLCGYWIPVVPPMLALWGSALLITSHMAHKASLIRATFCRYLNDEVVAQLMESREGFKLGGNRQRLTILASDLRGFTALSERLKPEEVVKILNLYFRQMSKVIVRYGGTINKLMGDGMLVLFNSSSSENNHAQRGIACAIAMQLEMKNVNLILNELGFQNLEMGIGLNTGEAVVGNIGSEEHTEYTAIGCEVNLAFRIESYTTGGKVLISENTKKAAAPAPLKLRKLKGIKMKGFKSPQKVYETLGIGQPYQLFLPREKDILLPLNYKLSLQYSLLQGEQSSNFFYAGELVKLSRNEAEIKLHPEDVDLLPLSPMNIKINLPQLHHQGGEESYAKVIRSSKSQQSFQIRFTYRPPAVLAQLEAIYESLQVLNSA